MFNFKDGDYEPNQSVLSLLDVLDVSEVLDMRVKVHQIDLPYHCKIVLF